MTQTFYPNTKVDKAMSPEQFSQIVDAILAGKYSWACVLLLRFAGYNPLHYIPYRTYNRLIKEHSHQGSRDNHQTNSLTRNSQYSEANNTSSQKSLSKISDLAVLEEVASERHVAVRGGSSSVNLDCWLRNKIREVRSIRM